MKLKNIAISFAIASTLSVSTHVFAHDVWVSKTFGEQTIGYGHGGTDTDPYARKKVESVKGFKIDGSEVAVTIKDQGSHVALDTNDAAIVAVRFNNGYYAQDKDGKWINKRGDQVEGAESSNQYIKESVAYQNPRVKPMTTGLTLEIVPSVNPSTLQAGEELTVRVLFNNKPVADKEVKSNPWNAMAPAVKTDKDGYATIKVATSSFNIVKVGHKVKADNPFDGKGYSSTLTFKAKRVKGDH